MEQKEVKEDLLNKLVLISFREGNFRVLKKGFVTEITENTITLETRSNSFIISKECIETIKIFNAGVDNE